MQATLFPSLIGNDSIPAVQGNAALSQWFTPSWAAECLFDHYFGSTPPGSTFCEVSCGQGNFLGAIPDRYEAFGVEIDPILGAEAETHTGRRVLIGDFREVELPSKIDAVIGNPPFVADVVDSFLDRIHGVLPHGGKAGFILPAYFFQTSSRVMRYNRRFSLQQDLIPGKDLFPGLSYPLCFVMFTKDRSPVLINMRLHQEADSMKEVSATARRLLIHAVANKGGLWRNAVGEALRSLGGTASIEQIYHHLSSRRPTSTNWWREKIRQVLGSHFTRVSPGVYSG